MTTLPPGELLEAFAALTVVAFEQGRVESPAPAVVQRLCAVRGVRAETLPLPPGRGARDSYAAAEAAVTCLTASTLIATPTFSPTTMPPLSSTGSQNSP